MTVSKFLHPYNPALFPVYDNAVIKDEVLPAFKAEFRQFCATANMPEIIGNTAGSYVSYMSWGSCLPSMAHSQFMQVFAEWLGNQPSAKLARGGLDATRLQATAYEFTLIGAYADSLSG